MLKTLREWYSLQQITKEQYSQLLNLVNSSERYSLAELQLLADLPSTQNLTPLNKDELARFKSAEDKENTYQAPQFDYVTMIILVVMVIIIIRNHDLQINRI